MIVLEVISREQKYYEIMKQQRQTINGTQIAILVCSNLALQICKLTTNLTHKYKLETSYCKRVSHHKSNLPQACCVKLIANYRKNRVQTQPRIRPPPPNIPLPQPVALTTQLVGL
ncbi:hypothetical protein AVEN_231286-1 [Araneus ventricosus]|uniref:Uncharacterized protein n=1 Tax=Araneus ventricosus TaxID=182803 RepID=A0A4Y2CJ81_ARAVE|nr:hypothetical protein AVEN_231286-1 [Araneus ventricosus]